MHTKAGCLRMWPIQAVQKPHLHQFLACLEICLLVSNSSHLPNGYLGPCLLRKRQLVCIMLAPLLLSRVQYDGMYPVALCSCYLS